MSAIYVVKNQVYHVRTKHIYVRFYFVREILDEGDIELQNIHTKENPVNMLTKVVPAVNLCIANGFSISIQSLELGGARLMN